MLPANTHEQAARDQHGRFARGRSGNPDGRPKVVAAIRDIAREHGPAAIARLRQLMSGADEQVSVAACKALLDRGYGRPPQEIAVTPLAAFDGEPFTVTDPAEASRYYQQIMAGELSPDAVSFLPTPAPASAEEGQ